MAMIDDQETLQIFLEDAQEHLSGIENDLLAIEAAGAAMDVGLVNKVFRAVHSIKGGAGFLGLEAIKELSHAMENLLNLMRTGELIPTSAIVSTLLAAADVLNGLVHDPNSSETVDISTHVTALQRVMHSSEDEASASAAEATCDLTLPDGTVVFSVLPSALEQARKGGKELYLVTLDLPTLEQQGKTPFEVIKEFQDMGMVVESKVDVTVVGGLHPGEVPSHIPFYVLFATLLDVSMICSVFELESCHVQALRHVMPEPTPPAPALASPVPPPSAPTPPLASVVELTAPATSAPDPAPLPHDSGPLMETRPAAAARSEDTDLLPAGAPRAAKNAPLAGADSSLRVHVKLLDRLMILAGELVLTRNQLLRTVASHDTPAIEATTQRVDLLTSELQEAIMSTRMQPLGNVFSKFQRLVRDLSKDLGKDISLLIQGEEVELDKAVIEAIGDPLTHLVRNGVDHGIELPAVRRQAGKPSQAALRLSARHEAGQVIIEVADDGAGIDPQKIRDKALSMGLHDRAHLEAMTDKEVIKLIFAPGFSTAKQLTDISGRGVGMDVVHTNLTKLGGTIDIDSQVGVGTTFRIKLPLTLAIIPCLLVSVAGERYAIPQVNLVELVRVPATQVAERVERIGAAMVMRRRGSLLPLVRLRDVITQHGAAAQMAATDSPPEALNILVVAAGDLHYGLIVDHLLDSEEIVVKPLGRHLQGCKIYAGATIQGDGRVALILDIMGLRTMLNLTEVKETTYTEMSQNAQRAQNLQDFQTLLLVRNAPEEQFAIPLSLVSRIEKVATAAVETSGGCRHMQYRGGTLRLLAMEDALPVKSREESASLSVIVFATGGREVGLMVSSIIDVLESEVAFDDYTFRQPGILGSAILMGHTTLLVDLFGLVSKVLPEWVMKPQHAAMSIGQQPTLLVVEDSNFFLHHIRAFVEEAGYRVITAMDGLQALDTLERHSEEIKLILTDIEMPNLDGLAMTERIRRDPRFAALPVIAVTSVAGEAAEKRGLDAGIDEYLIKLDQEKILTSVAHHLLHGRVVQAFAA
ncbi:MAG: chemotaxis protein CheW [Candidatus Tectimicrobiota bacterium]